MAATSRFEASTFIPDRDRWTACDGVEVVLNQHAQELITLAHDEGVWQVRRHRVLGPADAQNVLGLLDHINWRGTRYAAEGETLVSLTSEDPPQRWNALYREFAAVWMPD